MSADVLSPLPGLVATVHVNAGDVISSGDPVVTLQSMKMEIPITAESAGTTYANANGVVGATPASPAPPRTLSLSCAADSWSSK